MPSMHRLSPELLIFLRKVATGEQRAKACSCLRRLHSLYRISLPTKKPPLPKLLSRRASQQADDPNWISLVDEPQQLVRVRHNKGNKWGLAILALIPITAFALGSWQVKRLAWKNDLIARFEDRLIRPPLPLPPTIDPDVVNEFDYRRVNVWGRLRHDQEILVGPRIHDGADGYQVITPLERDDEPEGGSKILISRGWIGKDMKSQDVRRKLSPDALPQHRIKVQGLLREPFKKNMFTPDNNPAKGEWYFPDVAQMAVHTGSQPVWIEETTPPDLLTAWDHEAKGIPIGRPAEVNLRNNHTQYIFTWYSLSLATTIMFYMVVKKPSPAIANRVRQSRDWQ